jgi:hypothetical protein
MLQYVGLAVLFVVAVVVVSAALLTRPSAGGFSFDVSGLIPGKK